MLILFFEWSSPDDGFDVKKKFQKMLSLAFEVIIQSHSHFLSLVHYYIGTLTIEQFLMHPFSTCASLHVPHFAQNLYQKLLC